MFLLYMYISMGVYKFRQKTYFLVEYGNSSVYEGDKEPVSNSFRLSTRPLTTYNAYSNVNI